MEILVEATSPIITNFRRLNENWTYYSICWYIASVWCNAQESGLSGKPFDTKGHFTISARIDRYYLTWLFSHLASYPRATVPWFRLNLANASICTSLGLRIYTNIYLHRHYSLSAHNIDTLHKWKSEIYLLKKDTRKVGKNGHL